MILDWSNIGAHSRAYGFALDHNLEYWVYPPCLRFMIGLSMISQFLNAAKRNIDKK